MVAMQRFLRTQFVATSRSRGLGLLRLWTGAVMFLRHGWEKRPGHWSGFLAHFPDPIHIGSHPSFVIAFVADFVCAILLMIGLATRWAALFCFCNLLVAWAFVHHFAFFGRSPLSDHGELIVLYLGSLLALLIGGPGAYSVDAALAGEIAARTETRNAVAKV